MWAALAALCVDPAGAAQGDAGAIQPGQRRFAADYVAAASGDAQRMRALIHPKSLACMTDGNRDFFDEILARPMRPKLSGEYTVTSVRRIDPADPPVVPPAMGASPVRPTHRIQIDIATGPTRSLTVIRELAAVDGVWLAVIVCPTDEGLAAFRKAKQAGDEEQARARGLAAALPEPLRSELGELLKTGRRVDAVKRYRDASGEGLAMARRVVVLSELAP